MSTENKFIELAKINVNGKTEKKNNLTYLSWAWAVDQLLRQDGSATWTYSEPKAFGDTLMVFCTVTAFGKSMTAQLPVIDHRNKAIPNPDAFQVNVSMQRCLAKAIGLHGIGLYIYAGEDMPMDETIKPEEDKKPEFTDAEKLITPESKKFISEAMSDGDMATRINKALDHFGKKLEALNEAQAQTIIQKINAAKK